MAVCGLVASALFFKVCEPSVPGKDGEGICMLHVVTACMYMYMSVVPVAIA